MGEEEKDDLHLWCVQVECLKSIEGEVHYSFFRIQWESLLPHPQVLKILKLALEKYKCTKRQAKQALCSALNHFLSQVQPLCVILP